MGRFHRWWRALPVGLLVVGIGLAAGPTQAGSPTPTPVSSSPWAAGSPQVSSSLPPKMAPSPRALSEETVTILASADTFVVSNFPDDNFNGFYFDFDGDVNLFLVGNHYLTGIQRGLLWFEIYFSIPLGARINSATLYAPMYVYWNAAGPVISIGSYRLTSPWEESSVTWNSQPSYGEAYGSATVGTEFTWYAWDVTALVQGWVNGDYPNFGLMLRGPEAGGTDLKGFVAREQGDDWAPRLVVNYTPDTIAPTSKVHPLPPFSRRPMTVRWSGSDNEGGSGVANYDVQYRDGESGDWLDFLVSTPATFAILDAPVGRTYYFRSRARDMVGNTEEYPTGDGDAYTTLYACQLSGTVRDNRGAPVAGAAVHITPSPMFAPTTDAAGNFFAYLLQTFANTLHVTKSGYGDLPVWGQSIANDTTGVDLYLPPADDLVVNGGFEAGDFGNAWIVGGVVTPTVNNYIRHTGGYAVMLGQLPEEKTTGDSYVAQVITLPVGLHRPTLSFLYQLTTWDTNDWLEVTITSGITATQVFSTATNTDWTHKWVDLTPWAGETVTITFNVHETANDVLTWVSLDEVSVGPHLTPQVFEVSPTRHLPGSSATLTITGTNFISVPTVFLGTTPLADVGYVSSQVLTATVPSTLTLGLYDVTVRNPGGQEGLLPSSFHAGYSIYMPMITRLYSEGW